MNQAACLRTAPRRLRTLTEPPPPLPAQAPLEAGVLPSVGAPVTIVYMPECSPSHPLDAAAGGGLWAAQRASRTRDAWDDSGAPAPPLGRVSTSGSVISLVSSSVCSSAPDSCRGRASEASSCASGAAGAAAGAAAGRRAGAGRGRPPSGGSSCGGSVCSGASGGFGGLSPDEPLARLKVGAVIGAGNFGRCDPRAPLLCAAHGRPFGKGHGARELAAPRRSTPTYMLTHPHTSHCCTPVPITRVHIGSYHGAAVAVKVTDARADGPEPGAAHEAELSRALSHPCIVRTLVWQEVEGEVSARRHPPPEPRARRSRPAGLLEA